MNRYINFDDICGWRYKLIETFEKLIGDVIEVEDIYTVDSSELWKYFPFPEYTIVENDTDENGEKLNDGLVNTSVLVDDTKLEPNLALFKEFLSESISDIIGGAKELVPQTISTINERIRETSDKYIIYSTYKGKARPAVLVFLGSNIYEGDVKFIESYNELKDGEILTKERLLNLI